MTAPFLLSSLATDERGITIPGHLFSKSESVGVHYSAWKRRVELTVRYEQPDSSGDHFFKINPELPQYDAMHVGDRVSLHYLRRADVPDVPGARVLHELHALPMVRLADQRTFTNLERTFSGTAGTVTGIAAGVIVGLILLHKTGAPLFPWALGLSVAGALAALTFYDFPRPTPEPVVSVRQGSGRVKNLDRITNIFSGTHSRGMVADQAVDVVGIEFIPEGWTEPVLAVDLIDANSVRGLGEETTIPIVYEANSPRTAHIVSAKREFAGRNVTGIVVEIVLSLAVLVAFVFGAQWLGRAFNRLVANRQGKRHLG